MRFPRITIQPYKFYWPYDIGMPVRRGEIPVESDVMYSQYHFLIFISNQDKLMARALDLTISNG